MSTPSRFNISHTRLMAWLIFLTPPLLWAGNVIVARAVRHDIAPISLAVGRWLIAFSVLLPFVWRGMRRDWPLYRQHARLVFATAITGMAAFNTFVYIGLHHTTSTNALLLNSCIPVLIMLIGATFYGQRMNALQILGLLLSFIGIATIVLQGSWQRLISLSANLGDVWIFAAALCWACYTIWMKKIPAQLDRGALMATQILIGLCILLPLAIAEQWHSNAPLQLNTRTLSALAYIGLLPSVLAYFCYTAAIARFGAARAGLCIHLMPVFGTLLAVVFLNEQPQAHHFIGITAIFAGIALCSKQAT